MASLTRLTLQHVSLEDLIEIGLDNLPVTPNFISGLADNICPGIAAAYENDWMAFRDDLVFLLQSSRIPLMYSTVCMIWRQIDSDYQLIIAEDNAERVVVTLYHHLADVIKTILTTLNRYTIRASLADRYSSIETPFSSDLSNVYRYMAEQKRDDVDLIKSRLLEGHLVELSQPLTQLSYYPFTENISAVAMLIDQHIVVIGLLVGDDLDNPDPEYGAISYPYLVMIPIDQQDCFLGMLAYNQYNYRLI